jgi:tRNA(adenine34) deaminase
MIPAGSRNTSSEEPPDMPYCHDHRSSSPATQLHSRRAIITTLASAAVLPAGHLVAATNASADDERFMHLALDEARQADFPFGAVIVRDGQIIARGRNLGRTNGDPTAHGEMIAIRRCLAEHGSTAFRGTTLYTTGEPCAMCMGAILWCRVGRLVFAASVQQLATAIDQIMISSADIAAKAPFVPIAITGGVLADEAMQLFRK